MRHQKLNSIALFLLTLNGCAMFKSSQDAYQNQAYQAETFSEQDQANQQLNATASLLTTNNLNDAKLYAETIDPRSLSPAGLSKLRLLQTQISLKLADTPQALKYIKLVQPSLLRDIDKVAYYRSSTNLYTVSGQPINSIKSLIALQPLLTDAQQQTDNKTAIMNALNALPLSAFKIDSTNPTDSNGWFALGRLFKLSPNLSHGDASLTQWQSKYPQHPANGEFLNVYLTDRAKSKSMIAVFLPESGPYAPVAKAIKTGINAAFNNVKSNTTSPLIQYYNSAGNDPVTLYHKAVNAGANLIIGPLNKEQIEQLAKANTLEIPVLTLNHIPGLKKENLYQFALSPLDEVNQVADKAIQDGHRRLLLLTPKSELGDRIQGYFKTAVKQNGGKLVESNRYTQNNSNYTATLKELLNITESEQRYAKLKRILPTLKFSPRSRQDIDAIFVMAYPQEAKTIRTQLQAISKTSSLPIYATPHVYNGVAATATQDLNGITFCDIPWFFQNAYQGTLSQTALKSSWQSFPEVYLRLVAMGIDAYNLVPHLKNLNSEPYKGATGTLRLVEDNRIERQLVCASFNHSQPSLINE